MNLDPFDEYSDDDLYNVLDLAHLRSFVTSLPEQLEHKVAEGGQNLRYGNHTLNDKPTVDTI